MWFVQSISTSLICEHTDMQTVLNAKSNPMNSKLLCRKKVEHQPRVSYPRTLILHYWRSGLPATFHLPQFLLIPATNPHYPSPYLLPGTVTLSPHGPSNGTSTSCFRKAALAPEKVQFQSPLIHLSWTRRLQHITWCMSWGVEQVLL